MSASHIWHPCSQMKDYETFAPLPVVGAKGCYLYLKNHKKIIDAISSWWCKALGHGHPAIIQAIKYQLEQFEHVITANVTYDLLEQLSDRLCALMPQMQKVFYAGDGSCAVEIALKMSLQARMIQNESHKTKLIALQNSYHGETIGALSASDLGLYNAPYKPWLLDTTFIQNIPYVSGPDDPLWQDCSGIWPQIEKQLLQCHENATAMIVEPIIQGAGGMRIYSADFLKRLRTFAKARGIHFIADEIMTGLGRSGKMFACEHAGIVPDFLCLGKSLTAGSLSFSAVLTTQPIYELFYDDYETQKAFMHSHTYSGNALGASAALAYLDVMTEQGLLKKINDLSGKLQTAMQEAAITTGQLDGVRGIGAMVAADLKNPKQTKRLGYQVYQQAVQLGALLRPLGNTLYWLPPFIMDENILTQLQTITVNSVAVVNHV